MIYSRRLVALAAIVLLALSSGTAAASPAKSKTIAAVPVAPPSPPFEPLPPPKVYLFRGAMGPIFSTRMDRLAESPFTRIPVYRGSLDRLVGSINTKQLALRLLTGAPLRSLVDLLRPAVTVPDSLPGDRLLTFFRERRAHQAIVLDPAGRVAGIVSLEDVLQDLLT